MGGFLTDLIAANPGNPVSNIKVGLGLGLAVLLLIAFFITPIVRKKTQDKPLKKVLAKSRVGLLSFSLGFFFLIWFRLEQVPFLSMRLWFYLTILGLITWLAWKAAQYSAIKKRIERAEARRNRQG